MDVAAVAGAGVWRNSSASWPTPAESPKPTIASKSSTTSGTGSEMTPFAVITDDETGMKYPLADYALTPNMAIVAGSWPRGWAKPC